MTKLTFLLSLRRHFTIKLCGAILLGIGIIAASYFIGNSDIPMPDEMKVLRTFDRFMKFSGQYEDNLPDSILLVNVCYLCKECIWVLVTLRVFIFTLILFYLLLLSMERIVQLIKNYWMI